MNIHTPRLRLNEPPKQRQAADPWLDSDAAWRSESARASRFAHYGIWCRAEAFAIWRQTQPVKGTPAAVWLKEQGFHLPPPAALRFHPALEHAAGGTWPALVALVTDGREGLPLGIYAIYLRPDGAALAPVDAPTRTLGVCDGGVVRLGEPRDVLIVGVGLLTGLSVMQAGESAVWVALSEKGLLELDLPASPNSVIVLNGDTDAAQAAAWRWRWQGRRVALVTPLREVESCGCPSPLPRTKAGSLAAN